MLNIKNSVMSDINRRLFLKNSMLAGAGITTLSSFEIPSFQPSKPREDNKFGFSVLCESSEMGHNLYEGYDQVFIPITDIYSSEECKFVCPLESNGKWFEMKKEVLSWRFPIRNTSHFSESILPVVGPDADFELATLFVRIAMARCSEIGVKTCGIYGGYFNNSNGDKQSMVKITDQTTRFLNMCAEEAKPYGISIALEPMGGENTVWPLYLDAVEFARKLGHDNVGCMADTNYFIARGQDFEDMAKYPEYLIAAEMQGVNGQPGVGDREDIDTQFFRVLRDIGYNDVVDFACPWVNTTYGIMNFTNESRKSLEYVKRIRDKVYAE